MTSAPVIDERIHATAIKALLAGPLNGHAYDYDELPLKDPDTGGEFFPDIFAEVSIERLYVPPRPASGLVGRSGWLINVRFVAGTIDEARWAESRVAGAFEEKRLSVGGVQSTPVTFRSKIAIAPDEDKFSGESRWSYAL